MGAQTPDTVIVERRGLRIHHQPEMAREVDLILHELFDTQPYTRHGVRLEDGMCVVDLGANMGLFSLWCATQATDLRIVACEPVPALAALTRANTAQTRAQVEVLEVGIGAATTEGHITYYPRATACSSVYGRETEARMPGLYAGADIRIRDLWSIHKGAFFLALCTGPLFPWLRRHAIRGVLSRALAEHQELAVPFTTLTEIIRTHALTAIDLLKIDVQGSEWDVLQGIASEDWPRVRAIAMEVNTFLGPSPPPDIAHYLQQKGFSVTLDDQPPIAAPGSYFLYATRDVT